MKISEIFVGERARKTIRGIGELAASLASIGQLQPVLVGPDRRLIAGYRRLRAAKYLGWSEIEAVVSHSLTDTAAVLKAERDENTCREPLLPSEMVALGLAIEENEKKAAEERQAASRFGAYTFGGGNLPPPETTGKTRDLVGASLGVSGQTYAKAKAIVESGDAELIKLMDDKSVDAAMKELKDRERKAEIAKQRKAIASGKVKSPKGLFDCVVIDPPWPYGTDYDCLGRRSASPYPEMSLEDIGSITLPMASDCVVWLWTTHAFLPASFDLMRGWGLEYKATLIWDKEAMGLGSWLRMQCEFCLLGIRGKPFWGSAKIRDVIREPRREHSRKPEAFYKLVEELSPGKKLEYFSREPRKGWAAFGNDTTKFEAKA